MDKITLYESNLESGYENGSNSEHSNKDIKKTRLPALRPALFRQKKLKLILIAPENVRDPAEIL